MRKVSSQLTLKAPEQCVNLFKVNILSSIQFKVKTQFQSLETSYIIQIHNTVQNQYFVQNKHTGTISEVDAK